MQSRTDAVVRKIKMQRKTVEPWPRDARIRGALDTIKILVKFGRTRQDAVKEAAIFWELTPKEKSMI